MIPRSSGGQRAALWSKDWKLAAHAIAAMTETNRKTARWRYWTARSLEESHEAEQAQPLYETLLADDNYYSAMAAAHLGRPVTPHPQSVPEDANALATLEARAGFRARTRAVLVWHATRSRRGVAICL